jgi:hypothetical protein
VTEQRCGNCKHWEPDTIGTTTGWGKCRWHVTVKYPWWMVLANKPASTAMTEGAKCLAWEEKP